MSVTFFLFLTVSTSVIIPPSNQRYSRGGEEKEEPAPNFVLSKCYFISFISTSFEGGDESPLMDKLNYQQPHFSWTSSWTSYQSLKSTVIEVFWSCQFKCSSTQKDKNKSYLSDFTKMLAFFWSQTINVCVIENKCLLLRPLTYQSSVFSLCYSVFCHITKTKTKIIIDSKYSEAKPCF